MNAKGRSAGRIAALALVLGVALAGSARAQVVTDIVTDGSLGPGITVPGVGGVYEIGEGLGERHGTNLFQSFDRFSVGAGDTALFTADFFTESVLARVTGGVRSDIYGTIASAIPGADIYFLNPAGIIFGPDASLDVQGSFYSSTGDYLELSDPAQRFHADLDRTSSLSAAPVSAFGFLNRDPTAAPAGILVDESVLQVPFGETLAFVTDDVEIRGGLYGFLNAPGGRIAFVAVRSDGQVRFDPSNPWSAPELEGFGERGDILVGDFSFINVGVPGADAGAIYVRGRNFRVEQFSKFVADDGYALFGYFFGGEGGGLVDVEVDGAAEFVGGSEINVDASRTGAVLLGVGSLTVDGSAIHANAFGNSIGGGIAVTASGDVRIVNGGSISSDIQFGGGVGGSIFLSGRDVVLDNGGSVSTLSANFGGAAGSIGVLGRAIDVGTDSFIASQSLNPFGSSPSGPIALQADTVAIHDLGQVFTLTASDGNAGDIGVTAREVTVDGGSLSSGTIGGGDAGNLSIDLAETVRVANDGKITTLTLGLGNAGNVDIESGLLEIDAGLVQAISHGVGEDSGSGDITIDVGRLRLTGGGQIDNSTLFSGIDGDGNLITSKGPGGKITVTASESIEILGPGVVFDSEARSQISNVNFDGTGDRTIHLTTPLLRIDEGRINSQTFGGADAGDVVLDVGGLAVLNGGAIDTGTSTELLIPTDLTPSGELLLPASTGRGGNIEIGPEGGRYSTWFVRVDGGNATDGFSAIGSNTLGEGDAGDININSRLVHVSNQAHIDAVTATVNEGNAGNIDIRSRELVVESGGLIASSSIPGLLSDGSEVIGSGNAGSLDITAGRVVLAGRAGQSESALSSSSLTNGASGSIDILTGNFAMSGGARVSVRSEGPNVAGDIDIDVFGNASVYDSAITATAAENLGGNIDVFVASKLDMVDSEVTASVGSGSGSGGNITFTGKTAVLNNVRMTATADEGFGGNILLANDSVLISANTVLDASSGDPAKDGEVVITSPAAIIDASVATLEVDFLDASALMRPRCAAREAGDVGSFVVARRRGLPTSPEGLLLAFESVGADDLPASPAAPEAGEPGETQIAMAQGATAFRGGKLEDADRHWREASELSERSGDSAARSEALRGLAQTQQALGNHAESIGTLRSALDLARASGDRAAVASALGSLGNAHFALGRHDEARELFDDALENARAAGDDAGAAVILNNLGNEQAARGAFDEALASYAESAQLAQRAGEGLREAQALSNAARAALDAGEPARATALLERADQRIDSLEASQQKVYVLIHLGKSYEQRARISPGQRSADLLRAHARLTAALELGESLGDDRARSYALGNLGTLYEGERRYVEARYLTRQAVAAAEAANAPESLYRWYWQEGRILWGEGRAADAIQAYRRSVDLLEETRQETLTRYDASEVYFRRAVAPVYLDLVDALLQSAQRAPDTADSIPLLVEARGTMEHLKAAELRDYFRDECVADLEAKSQPLDRVAANVAVIYPILLQERTELLVSLPSGLRRYTAPASGALVTDTAWRFRAGLQQRISRDYLATSQQLYDWLVRPYERDLATEKIDTLVFVPDGALRAIPMAALHDGEAFLVQRYALAVTPGLSLVDPKPLERKDPRPLLAGLSAAVQGFPALPMVADELTAVQEIYGGEVLLDEDFDLEQVQRALDEDRPAIVHLASHAEFSGDPDTSFLLTYDDRLTLDRMGDMLGRTKFSERPVELLILSACETAAGNDRAALGLAGVAIQAGARSAMGSLWRISDDAAFELVVAFYRELKQPGVSRAVALQRAQLSLMESGAFEHPFYWSPYLLISDWL
jgi:filamentous hemagglutinin family protein